MLRLKQTQFTPTATFIGAPRGRIPHYFAQIVQMPVRGAPPPLSMHLMGWWVGFMGWSWEKNNVKPLSNCEASDMTCIFNIIYRCSKGNKTTALQSLQSDLILWTLWVHDIQTSTPYRAWMTGSQSFVVAENSRSILGGGAPVSPSPGTVFCSGHVRRCHFSLQEDFSRFRPTGSRFEGIFMYMYLFIYLPIKNTSRETHTLGRTSHLNISWKDRKFAA
jgi:hypothetical protein